MTLETLLYILGITVVASPASLLVIFGVTALLDQPLSERWLARLTEAAVFIGLIASIAIVVLMLAVGTRHVPIEIGNWVVIPEQHFQFHLKFVFDRLSVPFVILSFVLCGTIGAFTSRYLHREPGYGRFFVLFALFLLGMVVSSLAGTIETLFFGWEFVGLSSALLVAYFHERQNPVRNGQQVWTVYRFADAAFLIAALTMHHLTGGGDFEGLMGTGPWPEGQATISQSHALFVGLLLLVAAAGKSALVPFSGWLPRAMEGPTPSSAIFYGALSVHLGAFWQRVLPNRLRAWAYRFALERGFLDAVLNDYIVRPFVSAFRKFDSWERRWTDLLSGGKSRESDEVKPHTTSLDEFV